jgi:hypothetical protein
MTHALIGVDTTPHTDPVYPLYPYQRVLTCTALHVVSLGANLKRAGWGERATSAKTLFEQKASGVWRRNVCGPQESESERQRRALRTARTAQGANA